MRFRKPTCCPTCSSGDDIRFIIRGLPSEDGWKMIENHEAVAGGCIIFTNQPMWRCGVCGCDFSDESDPAVIEHRRFLQRLLGDMSSPLLQPSDEECNAGAMAVPAGVSVSNRQP